MPFSHFNGLVTKVRSLRVVTHAKDDKQELNHYLIPFLSKTIHSHTDTWYNAGNKIYHFLGHNQIITLFYPVYNRIIIAIWFCRYTLKLHFRNVYE